MDAQQGDLEPIAQEQANTATDDDQTFDTIEDALEALADNEDVTEEPQAEDEPEEESEDDTVELDDGTTATLEELKEAKLKEKAFQADYTRKTQEVAQERKAVEATKAQLNERTEYIESVVQNLSAYLEKLIPADPPLSLAQTDPGRYQYQRALRENAIAELNQLVQVKERIDTHKQAVSTEEFKAYQDREQAALLKKRPELSDPARRAAFDETVKATALSLGFTEAEIAQTADHRILDLVYLARIGQKAIENRNNAKRRVETPKAARVAPKPAPVNVQNKKAMHALSKSGRFADALKIDFD